MGSTAKEFQLIGSLGRHGPYTFFRSIKIGSRTLSLTTFFPVKPWPDSAMLSIAEVQLLWTDRTEGFCSLKLYFLPENTPEGRRQQHGEDEVIALQDKVIIRTVDLSSWLVNDSDWDWGLVTPSCCQLKSSVSVLAKSFLSDKFQKNDKTYDFAEPGSSRVVVLNYERYIRLRSVLKRLEGSPEMSNWLNHPLVLALGNINVGPGYKVLFTKEVFDYPELEDHELLCNHLAPKLKGRPRKKRKRNPSFGSESNESEISSSGSSKSDLMSKICKIANGEMPSDFVKVEDVKSPISVVSPAMSPEGLVIAEKVESDDIIPPNSNGLQVLKVQPQPTVKNGKIEANINENITKKKAALVREKVEKVAAVQEEQNQNEFEEKKTTAEILGPALTELAEKLEKSNAIKILAVRSSVITKMDSSSEVNVSLVSSKADKPIMPIVNAITVSPVTNSHIKPSEVNAGNGKSARIVWPEPEPSAKPTSWFASSKLVIDERSKPKKFLVPPSTRHESNEKPEVTITPSDRFRTNNGFVNSPPRRAMPLPRYCSSPFASSTVQVYGDPAIFKSKNDQRAKIDENIRKRKPETLRKNDYSNTEGILDFSFKKGRPNNENNSIFKSSGSNSSANLFGDNSIDSELLDLSTKSHRNNNLKNISHIPPPSAMNQMGVQLTSEVTLFPAGSRQPSVSNMKQSGVISMPAVTPKRTQNPPIERSPAVPIQSHTPNKRSSTHSMDLAFQSGLPTFASNGVERTPDGSGSGSGAWKLPPAMGMGLMSASSSLRNNPHPQPRFGHPLFNQFDRLPQPGHVLGTAAKPVASKGSRQNENGRVSREPEIPKLTDIDLQTTQAAFHQFMNMQRPGQVDPFYMSLCSRFMAPYGMPSSPHPDLSLSMEEWRRYQDAMRSLSFQTDPK